MLVQWFHPSLEESSVEGQNRKYGRDSAGGKGTPSHKGGVKCGQPQHWCGTFSTKTGASLIQI